MDRVDGRWTVKRLSVVIGLLLCSAVILGVTGCQDISTPETTTTSLLETTTSIAETTTTTIAETTTTASSSAGSSAAATTTTTLTPLVGALAAPKPKDKLLKGTWTWDVDKDVDGGGSNADIWYRIADEVVHYLEPQNGAGLARISGKSFDSVDRDALQALSYTSTPLYTESVDDPDVLMEGDVFALRTNTGQYVKLQVSGYEPRALSDGTVLPRYNIRLRYVIYPR